MKNTNDQKETAMNVAEKLENTGSTEVQISMLTKRISNLTEHFKKHKHDHHSRRGLIKLVSKRRRLLKYLNRKNLISYKSLILSLGLRK